MKKSLLISVQLSLIQATMHAGGCFSAPSRADSISSCVAPSQGRQTTQRPSSVQLDLYREIFEEIENNDLSFLDSFLPEIGHDFINTIPEDQSPLLHIAVSSQNIDSVVHLIQHGANVNQKDASGNTAMHIAMQLTSAIIPNNNNTPTPTAITHQKFTQAQTLYHIIRQLLAAEGSLQITNNLGQTPLDIVNSSFLEVMVFIEDSNQLNLENWDLISEFSDLEQNAHERESEAYASEWSD